MINLVFSISLPVQVQCLKTLMELWKSIIVKPESHNWQEFTEKTCASHHLHLAQAGKVKPTAINLR